MLTIFTEETQAIEAELNSLLNLVETYKAKLAEVKAREAKASQLLSNLAALIEEFPQSTIAQLRSAILQVFPPESLEPYPDESQPEQPPEPAKPKRRTRKPKAEAQQSDSPPTPQTCEPESQPEPDQAKAYPYCVTEYLNDTVMYIKKDDGELLAGYVATASRELATDWAECLSLWGCRAEARKAKRFGSGIQWEVKATRISMEQLISIANHHGSLYDSVPKRVEQLNMNGASENGNAETKETISESASETSSPDPEEEAIENRLLDSLGVQLQLDNSDFTCPEWIIWFDSGDTKRAIGRIRKHLTREQNPWLHSELTGYEISRNLGYPDKYSAARALVAKYQAREAANQEYRDAVLDKYADDF